MCAFHLKRLLGYTLLKMEVGHSRRTIYYKFADSFDWEQFSRRLWGEIYFDKTSRKFGKKPFYANNQRTFVEFILEPMYKIFSQVSFLFVLFTTKQ